MRESGSMTWIALALTLTACGGASDDELIVHCTASLATTMHAVTSRFEATEPGMKIRLNAASSLVLERQIRAGAPGDLVVLAAHEHLDRLLADGRVLPWSSTALVRNRLALVVRKGHGPQNVDELIEGNARLALASEGVPAGDYARSFLRTAGIWERVKSRCIPMRDEPTVLRSVLSGAADAGVVYASSLQPSNPKLNELRSDPRWQPPIEYAMAIAAGTSQPELAERLHAYLLSSPAQEIFERYGFVPLSRR